MDLVWSVLVLLGIEKLRIVPGFTEANALDLYYMPYTHGLPGSIVLSLFLPWDHPFRSPRSSISLSPSGLA